MAPWRYQYMGLSVVSDLEIPEWAAFAHPGAGDAADVVIELAGSPTRQVARAWQVAGDEYRLSLPEAGEYCVRAGRAISVSPVPGADWRAVRVFLLGSAWGALCYQRGLLVLHASAMCVGAGAVAFCAPQGQGKSSLAAWMAARGHPFVSDDLCRIALCEPDMAVIYPATPRLKLWRETLDRLGWQGVELDHAPFGADKLQHPPAGVACAPVALRAIYLLEWGESSIIRLQGYAGLRRLVSAATYRPELLEPLGRLGAYWRQCLELTQRVPVWQLTRPRDFGKMDATVDALIEHISNQTGPVWPQENDADSTGFYRESHEGCVVQQAG